ncbi:MAG TPA: penicillin-binding protein 1C [Halothiobacillus sp.]|nr:penicillin-binding protein 1C [Halothiobacillus sp.]
MGLSLRAKDGVQPVRRPWRPFFVKVLVGFLGGSAILCAIVLGVRLWYQFHPPVPLRYWLPSSTAVLDDQGRLLRLTLAADQQFRLWTPLDKMSPALVQAVLLHEDQHFYQEPGFNPFSLMRGAFKTYILRRHPQGGSTITMQLARLLWHMDTRSPWGKLEQVGRAIELELQFSKQEILEAYLNDAPFGGNIQGVGAASLIYFNHAPDALSLPESLALAVLPQNPSIRGRIHAGLAGSDLLAARNRLYRRWLLSHPASQSDRALFDLPLVLRPASQLPFLAPWFVDQLLAEQTLRHSVQADNDHWIHSTVSLRLQQAVNRQVQAYVAQQAGQGVHNAAVLLVDTRDMGIKAMVGSADYFNTSIDGQVNGTNAKRSPGSALKPFIYGLGFDQGIIIPATVLRDVPTAYGSYAPENFDGRFQGPVTVTQALIRSRNIPAIDVAAQLSHPDFYHFLQSAGVADMASQAHYGLALVLGGGEVTLQEMATLYAMLANQGVLSPLHLRQSDSGKGSPDGHEAGAGTRMLSRAACFMVLDILRQNPPPLLAPTGQPSRLPVAWKTGTSSSFRDAWSVGVFGPYVLVVWVGNFDGSPNPAFVGGEIAAPLFFNIVSALKANNPRLQALPESVPERLRKVSVCLSSGALPTAWCPRRGESWFIPGVSPIAVDDVYRPVMVNKVSGAAVCPPFDTARDVRKVFAFWPSDLQHLFTLAGIPRAHPPQNSQCRQSIDLVGGMAPQITSPLAGSVYALRLSDPTQARIPLAATTDADVVRVYWFAGRSYLGQTAAGQTLFWSPEQPGSYTLRAVDDHGRADERLLRVARVP